MQALIKLRATRLRPFFRVLSRGPGGVVHWLVRRKPDPAQIATPWYQDDLNFPWLDCGGQSRSFKQVQAIFDIAELHLGVFAVHSRQDKR
jgi:hypothetical protein